MPEQILMSLKTTNTTSGSEFHSLTSLLRKKKCLHGSYLHNWGTSLYLQSGPYKKPSSLLFCL